MSFRKRAGRGHKRRFSRTAARTNRRNRSRRVMRGGYRI